MPVHEMLGKVMKIGDRSLRIGYLRRECDLGVASDNGHPPAFLVRLSDAKVVRQLDSGEDFDAAILSEADTEEVVIE